MIGEQRAGDEADVIDRLRKDGEDSRDGWIVIGPIAGEPSHQIKGIGRALAAYLQGERFGAEILAATISYAAAFG